MKYITNFLWFLFGITTFAIGSVFFVPAVLFVLVSRLLSVLVITTTFTGLLTLSKLFGANAQQMRQVRASGLSCIQKL